MGVHKYIKKIKYKENRSKADPLVANFPNSRNLSITDSFVGLERLLWV